METLEHKLIEVTNLLQETRTDAVKAQSGNKSAGVRVRKQAQEAINKLKELRARVLEMSKE